MGCSVPHAVTLDRRDRALGEAQVRNGQLCATRPGVLHCGVHVIVVGCGRVGSGLAISLSAEGHSVAVLDKSSRAFRRLKDWDGPRIVGSGFDRDDLEKAGALDAGALAAVTSGDNTNILTVRIARETYKIPNVVARIYDPRRAEIYQRLGIPTVATVTWTIDQVRRRLLPDEDAAEWSDPTGRFALIDRSLPDAWAGKPTVRPGGAGKSQPRSGDACRRAAARCSRAGGPGGRHPPFRRPRRLLRRSRRVDRKLAGGEDGS